MTPRWKGAARVAVALLAVALLALPGVALAGCSRGSARDFPTFVYGSSASLEAYRAAASLPRDVLERIPCYCGCATSAVPHRHLRDCFLQDDGSFNDHASQCDICGREVLDVQDRYSAGASLAEIRAAIDTKYAVYGQPTDTAPVEKTGAASR